MKSSLSERKTYLNVPNYFSFARVVLVPVVLVLLIFQGPVGSDHYKVSLAYFSALFFVLAGISDLFDGYFARRMKITSFFGKFLDPLADKLMIVTVLVMLIPLGEIPAWLVVLFILREIAITGLRGVAVGEGIVIGADAWGKKKTALQNVALTCFLLPPVFVGLHSRFIGWIVLAMAFALSLFSGLNYIYRFYETARRMPKKTE
ncbi:MAG: CDP-diacylglycerol--glycerol-3-phosphate 3-phosphatidyltransferase [bacterium]